MTKPSDAVGPHMEEMTTETDVTVYVSTEETERGSKGTFRVTYLTDESEVRYGFYCEHCGSFDVAMDTMGRIVCNECGNTKKAEEWDAVKG